MVILDAVGTTETKGMQRVLERVETSKKNHPNNKNERKSNRSIPHGMSGPISIFEYWEPKYQINASSFCIIKKELKSF